MPIGLLFWMLMVLWFVLGSYWYWPTDKANFPLFGGNLMLFILLFLLGWKCFGFIVAG